MAVSRVSGGLITAGLIVLMAGCGSGGQGAVAPPQSGATLQSPAPSSGAGSPTSGRENREPATVKGLVAAVLTHLDPDRVKGKGGGGSEDGGSMSVHIDVEVSGAVVPLEVVAAAYGGDMGRPSEAELCPKDPAVLRCTTWAQDDGSFVVRLTATEDLTGGILDKGLVAYVMHMREDEGVIVMQTVPDRQPDYVDMTRLPLDVTVLEQIATDPLVGTSTSPELNRVGEGLEGIFGPE